MRPVSYVPDMWTVRWFVCQFCFVSTMGSHLNAPTVWSVEKTRVMLNLHPRR